MPADPVLRLFYVLAGLSLACLALNVSLTLAHVAMPGYRHIVLIVAGWVWPLFLCVVAWRRKKLGID